MTAQQNNAGNYETKRPKPKEWVSRWAKFNFARYWKDFNRTAFYWSLALIAVFILFQEPIKKLLNSVLVDPLIEYCPQNWGADVVFGSFLTVSLIFFIRQLRKHVVPTINSLIFSIAVLVIHFAFFKHDQTYTFYHYSFSFASNITYATSFVFSLLAVSMSYKSYFVPLVKKASVYSLLDDYPSPDKYDDFYGRTRYATSVAKHITDTSSDVSFAIGIIGDWGSGKSDFMLRLKNVLKNDENKENIVFDFNPWRVSKADAIIEEFFKTLSKQLKPYNQSISSTINDYSNRVLKTAKETHFRLADALVSGWFKEEDIQEKYDTINEAIKATSKRIVVFIDDVDRLTGKEVMEVLRVIRNTANFANTFFIVGIDQNYIVNVLKNTKDFANEEEYLKKVFQLTITLPAFKKDAFLSQIRKYLFTSDMDGKYKKRINLALTHIGIDDEIDGNEEWFSSSFPHEFLLEKMIDTVRDLKRFCNSFKIAFEILKDEAEISDLIVLELIRNKNILVYNSIRNRKIITQGMDSMNKLTLDKDEWEKLQKQLPDDDRSAIVQAVDFLFTDKQFKIQRKIILAHNFYIYFSYQLFNLISLQEFNAALELEADEMLKVFERWIKEGKEKELSQIFTYVDDFADGKELQKVVTVLLRLWHSNSNWYDHAKQLVFINWKYNQDRYFNKDKTKHKEFFCAVLNDASIDFFTRARLANEFIKSIREGAITEAELFISKKELRNAAYHLFHQYLNSNPDDPFKTQEFYKLNEFKTVKGKALFFPPVSRRFKKYLLNNNEGFKGYVKAFLRPSQDPYIGKLVVEPWIEQIFGDWHIFEEQLSQFQFDDKDYDRLKRIILEYLPEFFNSNRTPFKIKDEGDAKFVDDFLNLKRQRDPYDA